MSLQIKKDALISEIRKEKRLAVAFSGGVDSTFLLMCAAGELGSENILAVTARTPAVPPEEIARAESFAAAHGIAQVTVTADVFSLDEFCENTPDRCYICKKKIFSVIIGAARARGFEAVAEGTNIDDTGDYRPGLRAIRELHVLSPLRQAGLGKEDIRALSREMGLVTWNKPSLACLATRIPYGERITGEKLAMIDSAESYLHTLGFGQLRVRHQGAEARIELAPDETARVFADKLAGEIDSKLRGMGFRYVSLDLRGYRTGSLNETLPPETLRSVTEKP
jgi:uncharacterized protein